MAKDKNGNDVKEGDLVTLACRVVGVSEGTFSAIVLAPVEPGQLTSAFSVNSKQVESTNAPPVKDVK